jgi:hypothetical protein
MKLMTFTWTYKTAYFLQRNYVREHSHLETSLSGVHPSNIRDMREGLHPQVNVRAIFVLHVLDDVCILSVDDRPNL